MRSIGRTLFHTVTLAVMAFPMNAFAGTGAPTPWQINLQKPVTPIAVSMQWFNDLLLIIITSIVVFVMGLLAWVAYRYRESANPVPSRTSHNTTIEVLWTIVPVLILVVIAIPSFRLLYEQFSFPPAEVTIKATGKQWYWSYEYPDSNNVAFDSQPLDESEIKPELGQIKGLSVDNDVVVPVNKVVHVLITGADVGHQWTIPAFGSRADAIPGRVNRTWFKATETGIYYGQCSALCGNGHPYMPIAVRVVSEEDYKVWVAAKQQSAALEGNRAAVADRGASR